MQNTLHETFILNADHHGQAVIDEALGNLIGETVCVSYTTSRGETGERRNFEPQISVQEELEGSSETGKFRVLINANSYSYFFNENVWAVVHDVDKNKRPVIFIS